MEDEISDVTDAEREHDLTAAHIAHLDRGTVNAIFGGR